MPETLETTNKRKACKKLLTKLNKDSEGWHIKTYSKLQSHWRGEGLLALYVDT